MNAATTSKYRAFSKVASSLVHEMKNPLSAITLGLEYLQFQGASGQMVGDVVKNMSASTVRLDAILEALHLFFIEDAESRVGMVKLSAILEKARLLLNYYLARNHINLDIVTSEREPWILGNECKLLTLCFLLICRQAFSLNQGGSIEAQIVDDKEKTRLTIKVQGQQNRKGDEDWDDMLEAADSLAKESGGELAFDDKEAGPHLIYLSLHTT